jgi:hypothetical protein
MAKLPNNIKELMQSPAYNNSNHPDHAATAQKVSYYFNQKYSNSRQDATGHNIPIRSIWTWHTYDDEKTCDECRALSGQIFENRQDVPPHPHHPNCRCWIKKTDVDDNNNPISNENREDAISKTLDNEGGYENNPNLIDQPTNMGITQPTLDDYNKSNPDFNFPKDVKDLTKKQAKQIYNEKYYDKRNIGDIDNKRIRDAVFDMGVMSNYNNVGKIVQKTLNETQNANLAADGKIGAKTKGALNNIPANEIDNFMSALKENRLEYLRGLKEWAKYGKGWTNRTNNY